MSRQVASIVALMAFTIASAATAADKGAGKVKMDAASAAARAELKGPGLKRLGGGTGEIARRAAGTPGRVDIPRSRSGKTLMRVQGDFINVDAVATSDVGRLKADLEALGLRNAAVWGRTVGGQLPLSSLQAAAKLGSLRQLTPVMARTHVGLTTTQGDRELRADDARQSFNVNGKGYRVGILSDSYNCTTGPLFPGNPWTSRTEDQANGDLPSSINVLKDYSGPGCIDEGRAMGQLIHDVAPGTSQSFYTAFENKADFANGIVALANAGAKVIVDDVIYYTEAMFQDDIIAQAVNQVAARGVPYFSSAGNAARSSYESAYRDAGSPGLHDFNPDPAVVDNLQAFTVEPGDFVIFSFQWDEPYASASPSSPGSRSDVDVFAVDDAGDLIPFCGDPSLVCQFPGFDANVGGDPVEVWVIANDGTTPVTVNIVVNLFDGPAPGFIKYVYYENAGSRPAEFDTLSPTTFGHANAAGAVAVGASFWAFDKKTPLGKAFDCKPRCLNAFSSAGGVPILFDKDGNRLAQPVVRMKPEVTGPDGGNTTFFFADFTGFAGLVPGEPDGWPNFFGTSASAPHTAAVAALMMDAADNYGRTLSPVEIRQTLQETAEDLREFGKGFDFDSGYGFVNAKTAVAKVFKGPPKGK
jgi:hypothetical protein